MNRTRVEREKGALYRRLREHLVLLEKFHHEAVIKGDHSFLGEIAGKLRLLVYSSRQNRPLLLDLISDSETDIPIEINKPRGKITMTLPEYLSGLACAIRLDSGELVTLSKLDLIALWAQQSGSAHEDWSLDERLETIFRQGLFVNGQPIHGAVLCAVCRTVLHVGQEFLAIDDAQDA